MTTPTVGYHPSPHLGDEGNEGPSPNPRWYVMGLVALEVSSITSASVLARNLESSLRLTALAVGAIGGFALWWQWWPKSVPASGGRHRVLCRAFNPLDGERCLNRAVRGYEGLCYDHYLEAMASGIE